MSNANETALIYVPEVTPGVTPVDDNGWKSIRYKSHGISASPQYANSEEIRSDRIQADNILLNETIEGPVDIELSSISFDDLFAGAFMSSWATNVLKIGTTKQYFSLEEQYLDIPRFFVNKGAQVGGFNLAYAFGSIIGGAFQFNCRSASASSGTSIVGAGTLAPPEVTRVLASKHIVTMEIDAVDAVGQVRAFNLSLTNNMRPKEALGLSAPSDYDPGEATVTGSIEAYFDTAFGLYDKSRSNTPYSVKIKAEDLAGNSLEFFLPELTGSITKPVPGKNTYVMLNGDFSARYNAALGSSVSLTRVIA